MAKNLGRLLAPAPIMRQNLSRPASEPTYAAAVAMRLVSYTTEKLQNHQQMPSNQQEPIGQAQDSDPQSEAEHDHDNNDDEEGYEEHVNKETGEVGGPRGPEPTRFGDWEKNGRCSDF